ncbi:MAG: protein-L-isoaspartate O-methyltransferase, partial [Bacteroidetes bacterium GWE2_29_8]
ELKEKGIKDANVLDAIMKIPRHAFLDSAFITHAYEDKAFPIGAGQTISQPYTVAKQSELLEIKKNDKVLEIGTGSGYQAAVLHAMGANVFSIERHRILHLQTKALFEALKINCKLFFGDGYEGLPTYSPFDKIIITAAAPEIPEKLKSQLKIGGIIVVPVNYNEDTQLMTTVRKLSDNEFKTEEHGSFKFVPMLNNKEW